MVLKSQCSISKDFIGFFKFHFTQNIKLEFYIASFFITYNVILQEIPDTFNPFYVGWDRSFDAASEGSICIHHPDGDYKKISFDFNIPESSSKNQWRVCIQYQHLIQFTNTHYEYIYILTLQTKMKINEVSDILIQRSSIYFNRNKTFCKI